MNLLVLANCPLNETTGSGYVVLNYCRELETRGHQVDLFAPGLSERATGGTTYRKAISMLLRACRQTLTKKYDIVEFYGMESWLAAICLSKLSNRPLLVSHSNGLESHSGQRLMADLGSSNLDGSPPRWHQRLLWQSLEKAFTVVDGLVTVSKFDLDFAVQKGYQPASRLAAIDNALPDEYLRLKVDFRRRPVIGYCGSWLLRKGTNAIVPAVSQVLEEFPQTSLMMIGVGSDFKPRDYFPASILERINLVPFVESKDELRRLYQSIAILIMPSIYESFGMVSAESMACGCALISTRVGFPYSLKDREEAVLIDPTAESLYQGIRELLLDDGLRVRIAQKGYERVQDLRWGRAAERLSALYNEWSSDFKRSAQGNSQ